MKIKEFLKKLEEANKILRLVNIVIYIEDYDFYDREPIYNYNEFMKYLKKVYNKDFYKQYINNDIEINDNIIILHAIDPESKYMDYNSRFELKIKEGYLE